uniref:Alanyl-tRNA synthetase domain-containing protein 1-B n=1 Tax=Caligus rogercresseyi TaxID=217165 RepID=C1BQC6_CALRO|nr:Alanyl-tRNA synthetase domain-containing protein 1-B [Caligus rogercresseyi]
MFACQKDSYLKELKTNVTSIKRTNEYLEVELQDTILFPEGGGQNHDTGRIDAYRVAKVLRDGGKAVHYVDLEASLELDQPVCLLLDWNRRFDNMQQHTGQHLLSALLQSKLGLKTNSWWMAENSESEGPGISYIELLQEGGKNKGSFGLTDAESIEKDANQMIRDGRPVTVSAHRVGDSELERAYSRGLPEDLPHDALIRIVDIIGDRNMCCGTHVSNLSHLQMIKITQVQKTKKANEYLLYFVVGERVIRLLSSCLDRETKLTGLLKNRPLDHCSLVEKALSTSKNAKKINSNLLKELAVLEAHKILRSTPIPKFICNHRKDGNSEFVGTFIKELTGKEEFKVFIFLIVGSGEGGSSYQMTLSGDSEDIKVLGPKILKLLDGKGGGSGGRFNAKVSSLKEYNNAVLTVEEHFK